MIWRAWPNHGRGQEGELELGRAEPITRAAVASFLAVRTNDLSVGSRLFTPARPCMGFAQRDYAGHANVLFRFFQPHLT
jgi:hypothetical protein